MDKTVYKIITEIWQHLKMYLLDIQNSDSVDYWDAENEASHKIMATVDNEPEYIKKFTLALLTAEWELLHAIYRERSGNNDNNRANGDIQQQ